VERSTRRYPSLSPRQEEGSRHPASDDRRHAGDDPQGWEILDKINAEAADDPDLYIFTNLTGVGSMEVNAFQRAADIVLQKSIREGFGLVVAEAF
jgi:hypothetical protein